MWPIAAPKRNVPMAVQRGRGKRHPRIGGTMTEKEAYMFIQYMTGKKPIRALKYFYESNGKLYSAMYPISKPGRFVEGAVHHLTGQIGVEKCGVPRYSRSEPSYLASTLLSMKSSWATMFATRRSSQLGTCMSARAGVEGTFDVTTGGLSHRVASGRGSKDMRVMNVECDV